MSKHDKLLLDIHDIMQQLELDKDKWHQQCQAPKVTLNKQLLIDTAKRTVKLTRRIII